MPIIAIATTKGGSGKTTLTAGLADMLRRQGKSVECIDTDPNRNLYDWFSDPQADIPCTFVEEEAVIDAASAAAERTEHVLIDVAGALQRGMLYAISSSDLVLIPCKTDRKDVVEAVRTQELIVSAGKMVRRRIRHAAVLTQVNRRAQVTAHTREQLQVMGVAVLAADVPARTAYQQASWTGAPLAASEARDDFVAIVTEISSLLEVEHG
ncbi:ParA family protein [Azospirillum sp. RWY-5-1]|uniref:ParA family protein n=1 Tax=Azospirillum oleiclasticum TaxID=2735135 RepID=A0ABX2TM62_9PROT|nr:ParA family protein [Azospirillum oleiclasticum]NYZ24368.1 ParA family protein [Azospirillum oleiclasticum]